MTKGEIETIIRWDEEERVLHLYTGNRAEARKWARWGYAVEASDRTRDGEPRGWEATAPLEALRLRKLEHGQVVRRRRGRSFAAGPRKFAGPGRVTRVEGVESRGQGAARLEPPVGAS